MQDFGTLRQPLLRELAMSWRERREMSRIMGGYHAEILVLLIGHMFASPVFKTELGENAQLKTISYLPALRFN